MWADWTIFSSLRRYYFFWIYGPPAHEQTHKLKQNETKLYFSTWEGKQNEALYKWKTKRVLYVQGHISPWQLFSKPFSMSFPGPSSDFWKEKVLPRFPYKEFTDHLVKIPAFEYLDRWPRLWWWLPCSVSHKKNQVNLTYNCDLKIWFQVYKRYWTW